MATAAEFTQIVDLMRIDPSFAQIMTMVDLSPPGLIPAPIEAYDQDVANILTGTNLAPADLFSAPSNIDGANISTVPNLDPQLDDSQMYYVDDGSGGSSQLGNMFPAHGGT
jgi:hypothetical protein